MGNPSAPERVARLMLAILEHPAEISAGKTSAGRVKKA